MLQPYDLNSLIHLQNRMVMAPMTRCFADQNKPTEAMADYYARRGGFGLIISEATMVSEDASGYFGTPGIYSNNQIEGWRNVCKKVHAKGARFFLQLWHAGMMSHPHFRSGQEPLSASRTLPKKASIPRTGGQLKYGFSKKIDEKEMAEVKGAFVQAADNALQAGCDGIELHAANGYLLDSFLHYYSNNRTDQYGGSSENMCRYPLEMIDLLIETIGPDRLGVRLSPVPIPSMENIEEDERDKDVFIYLLNQLERRGIAYVHASSDDDINQSGGLGMPVSAFLKKHFTKQVIGCGGYTIESGSQAIRNKEFELIAFGKLAIANPDLVELLKAEKMVKKFETLMLNNL
ncbi:MAG: alkene reductase [Parachlamydia sp.]|nr:alkene reductase [Parachlamydia sp.]